MRGFGKRLRQAIRDSGIKPAELARQLKVTRGAVDNWIKDRNSPDADNIVEIAERTDHNIEWLLTGRGTPRAVHAIGELTGRAVERIKDARRLIKSFDPDKDSAHAPRDIHALGEAGSIGIGRGQIPELSTLLRMGSAGEDAEVIQVPVGGGSYLAHKVIGHWSVPAIRNKTVGPLSAVHVMKVGGNSMEPLIRSGDYAFIDTAQVSPSPEGIFAVFDGIGQTLKQVQIMQNSDPLRLLLSPINTAGYSPQELLLEEAKIIGRCIGWLHWAEEGI